MRMRMVKSDEEIAWIRESGIADIGGAACVEAIGIPEYEVALHATQAMVREIGRSQPHVELMDTGLPVRHQHRRCPQPGHLAEDRARRHPDQLLSAPATTRARAHPVRRGVLGRTCINSRGGDNPGCVAVTAETATSAMLENRTFGYGLRRAEYYRAAPTVTSPTWWCLEPMIMIPEGRPGAGGSGSSWWCGKTAPTSPGSRTGRSIVRS